MKRLLIYLLIFLASVWLGLMIHKDPGYVLITYQHWSLETTIWFALLSILVIFLLLYFLVRFFKRTSSLASKWQIWARRRQIRKAYQTTHQGLLELAEGNWENAQRHLIRGTKHNDTPLINYLAAAYAAEQCNHLEERDAYLREAHLSSPKSEMAIGLTQAQLQLHAKQWELALATLQHLHQLAPNDTYVLKLLAHVYWELQDYENLRHLLPKLQKHKSRKTGDYAKFEKQVYMGILRSQANASSINKIWQDIPSYLKTDPDILSFYIPYLIEQADNDKAENLLRDALKKDWSPIFLNLYGSIPNSSNKKLLEMAESWLKQHPNDPALLLCLGRLCVRHQLYEKARHYLEASLLIEPQVTTYHELGQVLEQLHETQAALEYYRKGLQLATGLHLKMDTGFRWHDKEQLSLA